MTGRVPFTQDLVRRHSGLELMRMLLAGELPIAPMAETLDFRVTEVEPGRVVFEGIPGPRALNIAGTIHGGYAATLLDSALACAVITTVPAGRASTTTELSIRFVRAMTATTGLVRAEAKVVHAGRRLATAEARLFDAADGRLYAHGSTSCMILEIADRPDQRAAGSAST